MVNAAPLRKVRKMKEASACAMFTNNYIEILAKLD